MATIDTKTRIAQTLGKKLENKEIEKITVQELSFDAGVTRQTFYYYFKDLKDVASYYSLLLRKELVRSVDEAPLLENKIYVLAKSLTNKESLIYKFLNSTYKNNFINDLYQTIKALLNKEIIKMFVVETITIEDINSTVEYITNAILGTILNYLNKKSSNLEQEINYLINITLKTITFLKK